MASTSMSPFYLRIIPVFLMALCFGVFFLIMKLFHWCYLVKSKTQHENWIKCVSNQTHSPLFAARSQDDCRKQFRLCVKWVGAWRCGLTMIVGVLGCSVCEDWHGRGNSLYHWFFCAVVKWKLRSWWYLVEADPRCAAGGFCSVALLCSLCLCF